MGLQLLIVGAGLINVLILFFALSSLKGRIRRASRLLGWFILGYFLTLANWIISPYIASSVNFVFPWIPVIFFIAPLGYFFLRAVDDPGFQIKGSAIVLLIPGVIDIIYRLSEYIFHLIIKGTEYAFLMNRGPAYFIHDGLAILFSFFCYALIMKFTLKLNHVENPARKFYALFIIFQGYMIIRWSAFYFVDLFNPMLLNNELFLGAWILEMIGLLLVGYKGLIDSKLFNLRLKKLTSIPAAELNAHSNKLLQLLREKKLYLKNDLTRKDLADVLDMSEVSVSHILNKGLETGFYPLINKLRAKEVIQMIEAGEHRKFTLETLAKKAGFGSSTTFNKAFKSETGTTPRTYLKSHK